MISETKCKTIHGEGIKVLFPKQMLDTNSSDTSKGRKYI